MQKNDLKNKPIKLFFTPPYYILKSWPSFNTSKRTLLNEALNNNIISKENKCKFGETALGNRTQELTRIGNKDSQAYVIIVLESTPDKFYVTNDPNHPLFGGHNNNLDALINTLRSPVAAPKNLILLYDKAGKSIIKRSKDIAEIKKFSQTNGLPFYTVNSQNGENMDQAIHALLWGKFKDELSYYQYHTARNEIINILDDYTEKADDRWEKNELTFIKALQKILKNDDIPSKEALENIHACITSDQSIQIAQSNKTFAIKVVAAILSVLLIVGFVALPALAIRRGYQTRGRDFNFFKPKLENLVENVKSQIKKNKR